MSSIQHKQIDKSGVNMALTAGSLKWLILDVGDIRFLPLAPEACDVHCRCGCRNLRNNLNWEFDLKSSAQQIARATKKDNLEWKRLRIWTGFYLSFVGHNHHDEVDRDRQIDEEGQDISQIW